MYIVFKWLTIGPILIIAYVENQENIKISLKNKTK